MNQQSIYNSIRHSVDSLLPGCRILLFGSRAKGNHNSFSDYDLLIITPNNMSFKEKLNLTGILDKEIVHSINAPVDILLNSETEVSEKKEFPGHIIKTALKEGLFI